MTCSIHKLFSLALATAAMLAATQFCAAECAPFKGTGTGVFVGAISENLIVFENVGEATHLGTWAGTALVELEDDQPVGATIKLVAANDDEVYLQTYGTETEVGGVSVFEVTGGTGRFEDATGLGSRISGQFSDSVEGIWQGLKVIREASCTAARVSPYWFLSHSPHLAAGTRWTRRR